MRRQLHQDSLSCSRTSVPIQAAQTFANDLEREGSEFNREFADRLRGQIAVAQLSGADGMDIHLAFRAVSGGVIDLTDESPEPAVDLSIQALIDSVLELR